jgi:hypothetical protein
MGTAPKAKKKGTNTMKAPSKQRRRDQFLNRHIDQVSYRCCEKFDVLLEIHYIYPRIRFLRSGTMFVPTPRQNLLAVSWMTARCRVHPSSHSMLICLLWANSIAWKLENTSSARGH